MDIDPKCIDLAEKSKACGDALIWLRAAPRTWEELGIEHPKWVVWAHVKKIINARDYYPADEHGNVLCMDCMDCMDCTNCFSCTDL